MRADQNCNLNFGSETVGWSSRYYVICIICPSLPNRRNTLKRMIDNLWDPSAGTRVLAWIASIEALPYKITNLTCSAAKSVNCKAAWGPGLKSADQAGIYGNVNVWRSAEDIMTCTASDAWLHCRQHLISRAIAAHPVSWKTLACINFSFVSDMQF